MQQAVHVCPFALDLAREYAAVDLAALAPDDGAGRRERSRARAHRTQWRLRIKEIIQKGSYGTRIPIQLDSTQTQEVRARGPRAGPRAAPNLGTVSSPGKKRAFKEVRPDIAIGTADCADGDFRSHLLKGSKN